MNSSPHGAAGDATNGDDGGGNERLAPASTKPITSAVTDDQTHLPVSGDGTSPDSGFITHQSKKAKSKAKKTGGSDATPRQSQSSGAETPPPPKKQSRTSPGPVAVRAKKPVYATVDVRIFQLIDCIKKRVATTHVIGMFAQVQRAFRTLQAESAGTYERIYDSQVPQDCEDLAAVLKEWLVTKPIPPQQFKERMRAFRLETPRAATQVARPSWRQALLGTAQAEQKQDGDSAMAVPPPPPPPAAWTSQPREPTPAEMELLGDITRGAISATAPPSFLKETGSVSLHAIVSTIIEQTTRGALIAQLEGVMRFQATTHHGLLRLINDITGQGHAAISAFKAEVVAAHYDAATNCIAFTMSTKAAADKWEGAQLPIQGRMITMRKPRAAAAADAADTVDLQAYEMRVLNLAGQLDALNVWHLFTGLLGLHVSFLEPAPPASDGSRDPTLWKIVVQARGCPAILAQKTKIVWGAETLWIHHTAFHGLPPCTKCGQATHSARSCKASGPSRDENVLVVAGPQLSIADDAADAARQGPQYLQSWLRDLDAQVRERSAMGGEDKPAPPVADDFTAVPTGPVYVTSAYDMMRKRFYQRIRQAESLPIVFEKVRNRLIGESRLFRELDLSYRREQVLQPPSGKYDYSLEFFRRLTSRPADFPEDGYEERVRKVQAAIESDMTDDDSAVDQPSDPIFAALLTEEWASIRQRNRERREAHQAAAAAILLLEEAAMQVNTTQDGTTTSSTTQPTAAPDAEQEDTAAERIPFQSSLQDAVRRAQQETQSSLQQAVAAAVGAGETQDRPDEEMISEARGYTDDEKAAGSDESDTESESDAKDSGAMEEAMEEDGAPPFGNWTTGHSGTTRGAARPAHESYPKTLKGGWAGKSTGSRRAGKTYSASTMGSKTNEHTEATVFEVDVRTGAAQKRTRRRRKQQLGIDGFYKPLPATLPADPIQRQSDAEVVFVRTVAAHGDQPEPASWDEKKAALEVREVATPPNGSCWWYSTVGATHGICPSRLVPARWALREAKYHREGVYEYMIDNFDELAAAGVIDVPELCELYAGTRVVDDATVAKVKAELECARRQSCKTVAEKKYWAGPSVLKTTAKWLRQPLVVFDVMADGRAWAQVYTLIKLVTETTALHESVEVRTLSFQEAQVLLRAYKAANVVPLVFALHHSFNGQEAVGHFTALRVADSRYITCGKTKRQQKAMDARLSILLRAHGFYPPGPRPPTPSRRRKRKATVLVASTSSNYEPSHESPDLVAGTRMPGARVMLEASDSSAGDAPASVDGQLVVWDSQLTPQLLGQPVWDPVPPMGPPSTILLRAMAVGDTSLHGDMPSPELTLSSSSFTDFTPVELPTPSSVPLFQASLPTPESALEDAEYVALLAEVNRSGPVPEDNENGLAKTARDNWNACTEWATSRSKTEPALKEVMASAQTAADVCDLLVGEPRLLLDLLRHLPYVPILAGRQRKSVFARLGKSLFVMGRHRMLTRLADDPRLSVAARTFCSGWAAGFSGIDTADGRWLWAQNKDRWTRLQHMVTRPRLAARSIQGVDDVEWGAVIVHLLVCSSDLRDQIIQWELPDACEALLLWTSHADRVEDTAAAARAIATGTWRAPTEYIAGLVALSQQSLPEPAVVAASGGSPRN